MNDDPPSVAVLALDATDHRLLERWELDNLRLDASRELGTHAWTTEYPHTREIWPTVATGLHPDDHGIRADSGLEWSDDKLSLASSIAEYVLPQSVRTKIGELLIQQGDSEFDYATTDEPTFLTEAYQWPGVTESTHLADIHKHYVALKEGELTHRQLRQLLYRHAGEKFGWLAACDGGVFGAHIHLLDTAGHVFADDEPRLREYYEYADRQVGHLRQEVDDVLIISDHGMQTTFLGDESPAEHSFHAVIAATDGLAADASELPEDVLDIADWAARVMPATDPADPDRRDRVEMAVDEEHLADLGYIES